MFKNNYQGGTAVEIFSGQGKNPVATWKLSGGPSAIHKEYDKDVRGFVYCLEGSIQTVKMQIPENGKMSLGLLQRFLVLQVNIPELKDFSIELVITDSQHLKRRLHLSTVHKGLSATPLHAKIPLTGLKHNIWSSLCIDLVSFAEELFRGFLTLDRITLFATCKVRRILTIKPESSGLPDDLFLSDVSLLLSVPRSCLFPAGVSHVTQVLNMHSLQKADEKPGLTNSVCDARSPGFGRKRPQGASHTATSRKSSTPSNKTDRSLISNTEPSPRKMNPKVTAESQSITNQSRKLTHSETRSRILREGTTGSLQPHPPKGNVFDKVGSKKMKGFTSGKEKPAASALPDAEPRGHNKKGKPRETGTPQLDEFSGPVVERAAPTPPELGLSDLQICSSSWDSNEDVEPQLSLQEVFTFLSPPHSPKRGQGLREQQGVEMGAEPVQSSTGRRHEPQPEDDFIGSDSDEVNTYKSFKHQRGSDESSPSPPRSLSPPLDIQHEVRPESHSIDQKGLTPPTSGVQPLFTGTSGPSGVVPTRCLSPSRQEQKCHPRGPDGLSLVVIRNSSVSLSRRRLQEVKAEDFTKPSEEDNKTLKSVDPRDRDIGLLSSMRVHGNDDDEELRMLASLRREQEEDECTSSALRASQVHRCNVSISVSSDDTSTWTHISGPANQGRHYHKEMNLLLQSNPREWMDVLSPPIVPTSLQRRSDDTRNNPGYSGREGDESVKEEENEEEYLNLLYDPCLNCYFDPKTGKYYELA